MTMDTISTKPVSTGLGGQGLSGLTSLVPTGTTSASNPVDAATNASRATFQEKLQAAQTKKPLTKDEARKIAGDLVSNALIMPIMKQIRRDPFGQNTIFSAGTGEKTFGPEFDMQLADRIAHSPRMTVTDALAERLANRGQPNAKPSANPVRNRSTTMTPGVDVHG